MTELKNGPRFYYNQKYRVPSAGLKDWNYGWPGYYFITACVKNRRCVVVRVDDDAAHKSEQGEKCRRDFL